MDNEQLREYPGGDLDDGVLVSKIYVLRGQKVMLDRDLAELYGVETKYLKRQVRRNALRFPGDFMFEMSAEELAEWRSQYGTSNSDKMGLRYAPMAFTEQGVAMLSGVLNGERAIAVNIQIMRVFTRMRELLMSSKELLLKMERVEQELQDQGEDIETIYGYIKKLMEEPAGERRRIGYRRKDEGE